MSQNLQTDDLSKVKSLASKWRREADAYQKQVEEARAAGTPHDQMLSLMTALRSCAIDIEKAFPERC